MPICPVKTRKASAGLLKRMVTSPGVSWGEFAKAVLGAGDGEAPGPGDLQAQGFSLGPLAGLFLHPAVPVGEKPQCPEQAGGDHAAGGALQAHFDGSIGHGSIPPLVVGCITFKHTAKCSGLQGGTGGQTQGLPGAFPPKRGGKAGPYPAKTPGFFSQHHHPTNSKGNWEEWGNPMHFPQKNKITTK